jgi:rubrerythrin
MAKSYACNYFVKVEVRSSLTDDEKKQLTIQIKKAIRKVLGKKPLKSFVTILTAEEIWHCPRCGEEWEGRHDGHECTRCGDPLVLGHRPKKFFHPFS